MKFFNKLNLRRFAKVAAVAAIGGTIFFGGNTTVNAAPDDMAAFREAYNMQVQGTRLVNQDLTLIAPNFHLDTNLKKNYSTNSRIPFFIVQDGSEMTLYVQRNGAWSKMILPGLPSGIAVLWRSDDPAITNGILQAVKSAQILNDTPDMRVMNVTLDGNKIAALLENNSQASFANLSGDALAQQREIFNRWLAAIKANDLTFAWTINKPKWETITAAFDLTDVMRAYARYVLDESAAGRITLNDEERDLLDAMGYYAELRSYTTYIDPRGNDMLTMPANLFVAPENDNALDDIFYEMTTVVEK